MDIHILLSNEVRLSHTHSVLLVRHSHYFLVSRDLEFHSLPDLDPLTTDDGIDVFLVTPDFPHSILYLTPEARHKLRQYSPYLPLYCGTLDSDGLWLTPQANVSLIRNELITIISNNLVAANNKVGGKPCLT